MEVKTKMDKKGFVSRVLATLAALGVIAAMCVAVGSVSLSRAENEDWREIARTRNSKVFQLYEQGKPGPYTRHEYSVGDMHYWDGKSWQDPDFGATVSEGEVRFDKLPVGVIFSEGGAISYNYFAKDATLMIWPKVGNTSVSPEFADSTVRYSSLWPGVGLALRPTGSGTKATLLFDQPGHPTSFEFVLTSNLEVVQNGNRIELRDKNGEAVLLIRPPFVVLDEINRRVGEVKLNDNIVTLSLPDLTGLSYPLEVDPTIQVGASLDDAYDNKAAGGSLYDDDWIVVGMGKSNTGPSDPSYAYVGGFRFQSVSVAHGATIETAKLQINHYNVKTNTVYLKVYGHDVNDSAAFSDATGENGRPSARTKTTAGVDWDPPSWYANIWYDSPEIKTVVQEIVDRGNWASGNDMTILVADDGSAAKQNRVPKSYDTSSTYAAKLVITVNSPPDAPTSLLCEGQTNPTGVTDTTPEFSAIVTDPNDGDTIDYAEVEVGTTTGGNDMWDSGWLNIANFTEGNRCADISYNGTTLEPDTTYYWRIRFKDDNGGEGAWSSNAQFTDKEAFYLEPASRNVTQGNTYTFDVKAAHATEVDSYQVLIGYAPTAATVASIDDAGWIDDNGDTQNDGGTDIDNDGGSAEYEAYTTGGNTGVSGSGTLATFTVTAQATGTFTPAILAAETESDDCTGDIVACTLQYDLGCDSTSDCDGEVDVKDIMYVAGRWQCDLGEGCYDADIDFDSNETINIVDIMQVSAHWGDTLTEGYTRSVEAKEDDAYQFGETGGIQHDTYDIYLGKYNSQEYYAGFIFRNLPITYGSVITEAYLILNSYSGTDAVTVEIFTEDRVDNEGQTGLPVKDYATGSGITSRLVEKYPGTSGYCDSVNEADTDYCGLWVEWTIPSGSGIRKSPNIAVIVQEAVGRADWHANDNISILIRPKPGTANAYRSFSGTEAGSSTAPKLELSWVENGFNRNRSNWGDEAEGLPYAVCWPDSDALANEMYGMNYNVIAWTESWNSNHPDVLATTYCTPGATGVNEIDPTTEAGRAALQAYYDTVYAAVKARPSYLSFETGPFNEEDIWGSVISGCYGGDSANDYDWDNDAVNDPLEYVMYAGTSFLAIKSANPSAGAESLRLAYDEGANPNPLFLKQVMDYGLGAFFDIAQVHYYGSKYSTTCWPNGLRDKFEGEKTRSSSYCNALPPNGAGWGVKKAIENASSGFSSSFVGYSGSRKKQYSVSESGGCIYGSFTEERQAKSILMQTSQAFSMDPDDLMWMVTWAWQPTCCPCYGLKDGEGNKRPAFYTAWAFAQNLGYSDSVAKMETGAGKDLPTGYEGYLFKTDTITRAVVWNNTGTSNLKIKHSSGGSGYVRIARSTKITDTERGTVDADYDGIGWAQCKDDSKCYEEDGSSVISSWDPTWNDQTVSDDYYTIDKNAIKEPVMIWSDSGKIEFSW
jgi:hypothetical protein